MKLHVNTSSRLPIYQQLGSQIREGIARGELQPETKLPSVRELSRELVVNPNTIARAYMELERAGFVVTRPGLGVFVNHAQADLTREARSRQLGNLVDQLLIEAVHLGVSSDEMQQLVEERSKQFQWKPIDPPATWKTIRSFRELRSRRKRNVNEHVRRRTRHRHPTADKVLRPPPCRRQFESQHSQGNRLRISGTQRGRQIDHDQNAGRHGPSR